MFCDDKYGGKLVRQESMDGRHLSPPKSISIFFFSLYFESKISAKRAEDEGDILQQYQGYVVVGKW